MAQLIDSLQRARRAKIQLKQRLLTRVQRDFGQHLIASGIGYQFQHRAGLGRFARAQLCKNALLVQYPLYQYLNAPAGLLLAPEPRRYNAGIVEDQ